MALKVQGGLCSLGPVQVWFRFRYMVGIIKLVYRCILLKVYSLVKNHEKQQNIIGKLEKNPYMFTFFEMHLRGF